jgi:hypothetical protein
MRMGPEPGVRRVSVLFFPVFSGYHVLCIGEKCQDKEGAGKRWANPGSRALFDLKNGAV